MKSPHYLVATVSTLVLTLSALPAWADHDQPVNKIATHHNHVHITDGSKGHATSEHHHAAPTRGRQQTTKQIDTPLSSEPLWSPNPQ